jgi:hypothetical protein
LRDEISQKTFIAGVGPLRVIEVDAGHRVLKHRSRLPRSAHRPSISAVFEELQLELEDFEDIAFIVGHRLASVSGLHFWP